MPRAPHLTALCLILAATTGPVLAQEQTDTVVEDTMEQPVEEEMAEDTMKEVVEEEMADETMTEEVMEEMADESMTEEVMEEAADETMTEEIMKDTVEAAETPNLEDIAATDPALDVRTNEEGEVDAMVMLSDVLFSFGDATLEPAAIEVLRGVAEKLEDIQALEITGHTDALGDEAFNIALGQRRADAVRNWLLENSELSEANIASNGVGEADPIAPNLNEDGSDNPEGRALNRRVEFRIPDDE